jgi:hypothetical protein
MRKEREKLTNALQEAEENESKACATLARCRKVLAEFEERHYRKVIHEGAALERDGYVEIATPPGEVADEMEDVSAEVDLSFLNDDQWIDEVLGTETIGESSGSGGGTF